MATLILDAVVIIAQLDFMKAVYLILVKCLVVFSIFMNSLLYCVSKKILWLFSPVTPLLVLVHNHACHMAGFQFIVNSVCHTLEEFDKLGVEKHFSPNTHS